MPSEFERRFQGKIGAFGSNGQVKLLDDTVEDVKVEEKVRTNRNLLKKMFTQANSDAGSKTNSAHDDGTSITCNNDQVNAVNVKVGTGGRNGSKSGVTASKSGGTSATAAAKKAQSKVMHRAKKGAAVGPKAPAAEPGQVQDNTIVQILSPPERRRKVEEAPVTIQAPSRMKSVSSSGNAAAPMVGANNATANPNAVTINTNAPAFNPNAPTMNGNVPTISANVPTISANVPTISANVPAIGAPRNPAVPTIVAPRSQASSKMESRTDESQHTVDGRHSKESLYTVQEDTDSPKVIQVKSLLPQSNIMNSARTVGRAQVRPTQVVPMNIESLQGYDYDQEATFGNQALFGGRDDSEENLESEVLRAGGSTHNTSPPRRLSQVRAQKIAPNMRAPSITLPQQSIQQNATQQDSDAETTKQNVSSSAVPTISANVPTISAAMPTISANVPTIRAAPSINAPPSKPPLNMGKVSMVASDAKDNLPTKNSVGIRNMSSAGSARDSKASKVSYAQNHLQRNPQIVRTGGGIRTGAPTFGINTSSDEGATNTYENAYGGANAYGDDYHNQGIDATQGKDDETREREDEQDMTGLLPASSDYEDANADDVEYSNHSVEDQTARDDREKRNADLVHQIVKNNLEAARVGSKTSACSRPAVFATPTGLQQQNPAPTFQQNVGCLSNMNNMPDENHVDDELDRNERILDEEGNTVIFSNTVTSGKLRQKGIAAPPKQTQFSGITASGIVQSLQKKNFVSPAQPSAQQPAGGAKSYVEQLKERYRKEMGSAPRPNDTDTMAMTGGLGADYGDDPFVVDQVISNNVRRASVQPRDVQQCGQQEGGPQHAHQAFGGNTEMHSDPYGRVPLSGESYENHQSVAHETHHYEPSENQEYGNQGYYKGHFVDEMPDAAGENDEINEEFEAVLAGQSHFVQPRLVPDPMPTLPEDGEQEPKQQRKGSLRSKVVDVLNLEPEKKAPVLGTGDSDAQQEVVNLDRNFRYGRKKKAPSGSDSSEDESDIESHHVTFDVDEDRLASPRLTFNIDAKLNAAEITADGDFYAGDEDFYAGHQPQHPQRKGPSSQGQPSRGKGRSPQPPPPVESSLIEEIVPPRYNEKAKYFGKGFFAHPLQKPELKAEGRRTLDRGLYASQQQQQQGNSCSSSQPPSKVYKPPVPHVPRIKVSKGPPKKEEPEKKKDNTRLVKRTDDMLLYSKKPRPVKYSPRNEPLAAIPNKIGSLGPDMDNDELLYKKAVANRVKDFSAQLREVNKRRIVEKAERGRSESYDAAAAPTKRDRALEFAKKVPKPPQLPQEMQVAAPKANERKGSVPRGTRPKVGVGNSGSTSNAGSNSGVGVVHIPGGNLLRPKLLPLGSVCGEEDGYQGGIDYAVATEGFNDTLGMKLAQHEADKHCAQNIKKFLKDL